MLHKVKFQWTVKTALSDCKRNQVITTALLCSLYKRHTQILDRLISLEQQQPSSDSLFSASLEEVVKLETALNITVQEKVIKWGKE